MPNRSMDLNKRQKILLEKKSNILKEYSDEPDPTKQKVKGLDDDDTGAAAGRAEFLLKSVKSRLRRLGFDLDDLDKQKTIQQLLAGPFGFTFSLFWPKKNKWGEKGNITSIEGIGEIKSPLKTRAKVKNPNANGGLVLTLKDGFDVYFFDESELNRTLGGGAGKLPPGKKGENLRRLLEEGVTYKVKIDKDIVIQGDDEEEGQGEEGQGEEDKDILVPEEISSGKNRNEIFRLLLKQFGNFNGSVVYGDGFKTDEQSREYDKLRRAVKSGKEDKSKLKEFRQQANRDSYSMMVSNLRKSYPTTFMKKLSKAFPEFNIQYTKENLEESFTTNLLEEENNDKYKRWSLLFNNKVISNKNIDALDSNIREFMSAVKKWFAVPVKIGNKSHSYNISYDEDKVNSYWNNFYGSKKESKISLFNVLSEMINEEQSVEPDYILLKIENGGLATQDEGDSEVKSRIGGETKVKGGFVDAILIKAGRELDTKTGEISGNFDLQPGFANLKGTGEKAATDEKSKAKINIKYNNDKVTSGTIEIENNPSNINKVIGDVIKSGDMKIKKSMKDGDFIVLSYPAKTSVGERVNNTWQEILKK